MWRDDQQRRLGIQQAWLTAALGRSKRMPALQRLLVEPAKPLHGVALQKRREEHRRAASPANVAAVNEHMARRNKKRSGDG